MRTYMKTRIAVTFFVGLLTMGAAWASATPITIPPGLNPGDHYFLAFVTAGYRDATSSNIADYDLFVTTQALLSPALAALSTSWKVIGSTGTVDAVTHIAVTAPVYRLDGVEIASGSADMFDGTLDASLSIDQYGTHAPAFSFPDSFPFTGSGSDGHRERDGHYLGPLIGAVAVGYFAATSIGWLAVDLLNKNLSSTFYGISGELEVPQPVPEPATITLLLGPALVLLRTRRRRARLATPATRSDPASH